jgi:CMP-N-acetylneuraminic acid synthetase
VIRTLGIVPARGGSKGVPGKNVRVLAGRPLIAYTARAARESGVLDRTILTTDSDAIAEVGRGCGLEVPFLRPTNLAADETPMLPVIRHAVDSLAADGWVADLIVLLQPTSPLRTPAHIRDVVQRLRASHADSVVTVVEVPRHLSPDYVMRIDDGLLKPFLPAGERVTRRQDARPAYSREGTAYAFWRTTIERFGNIYGERCEPLVIDAGDSLSIDSPDDWAAAERRLLETQNATLNTQK